MALRSTQPLTEMSTRNIYGWVKAAGARGWQPYHHPVPTDMKSGSLNLLESSLSLQAYTGIVSPLCLLSRNEEIHEFVILHSMLLGYTPSSAPSCQTPSVYVLPIWRNPKFNSVDKKNQLDVTFCILYFSSNSCPKHVEQLLEEK